MLGFILGAAPGFFSGERVRGAAPLGRGVCWAHATSVGTFGAKPAGACGVKPIESSAVPESIILQEVQKSAMDGRCPCN